jgi:hypothetical protein
MVIAMRAIPQIFRASLFIYSSPIKWLAQYDIAKESPGSVGARVGKVNKPER